MMPLPLARTAANTPTSIDSTPSGSDAAPSRSGPISGLDPARPVNGSPIKVRARDVAFSRKLLATLQGGMACAVPVAALHLATEPIATTILQGSDHIDARQSAVAVSLELAAEVVMCATTASVSHAFLDKFFYYGNDASSEHMLGRKKALAFALTALGSGASSFAASLAAKAITGVAVTASTTKETVLNQLMGNAIATPLNIAILAAGATWVYRNRDTLRPDSAMGQLVSCSNRIFRRNVSATEIDAAGITLGDLEQGVRAAPVTAPAGSLSGTPS